HDLRQVCPWTSYHLHCFLVYLTDCASGDFPSSVDGSSQANRQFCFLNHPTVHTIQQFVVPYLILDQIFVVHSRLLTPHYFVASVLIIPSSINSSKVYSMVYSFSGISI